MNRCAASLPPRIADRRWLAPAAISCALLGAVLVLFWYPPGQYGFYPRCLFHQLTGWACPGCGGLRAAHALLHGHWHAALQLNPLAVILLPALLLHLGLQSGCRMAGRPLRMNLLHQPWFIWTLSALIAAFWIGRNLPFGPLARFAA